MHRIDLRFRSGAADMDDLRTEISATLKDLADPASEVAGSASLPGADTSAFVGAQASVSKEAKGFGDVAILIAITAPAAAHVLNKVWDDIIWPRIKSHLGADALGRREGSGQSNNRDDSVE